MILKYLTSFCDKALNKKFAYINLRINLPIEEIRVGHIKKNFPLAGSYYFRFKFQSNNTIIWMDLNNDDCKIPLYNGQIFMKVERFSWENPGIADLVLIINN